MEYDHQKADEAVLALLFLNVFQDGAQYRAWKGFPWECLDRLHEKGWVSDPRSKAKSVAITAQGLEKAEQLLETLFGLTRIGDSPALFEHSYGIIPCWGKGEDTKFLLIQHQAGHWGFPKGHSKAGESPIEAARREFEEETGIEECTVLNNPSITETYTLERKGRQVQKEVTYYVGLVLNCEVTIQQEEIRDSAWLPYEETLKRITYQESREALKRARKVLRKLEK